MIEAKSLSKSFENIRALDNINASIRDGDVFGLIGTNGAGKSTFLKTLAGILKPDSGEILIDGEKVFENINAKEKFFYISDDQYFFANTTGREMIKFYSAGYKNFDVKKCEELLKALDLDINRKVNTFSKGMKKQLCIAIGVASNTRYLLCDETFDGLDPVMRQAVKSLFAKEMDERGLTPIIASHNLRELEDICDHVGLLHKGGILLSKDVSDMKLNIHKVQCVFDNNFDMEKLRALDIMQMKNNGRVYNITIKGSEDEIREQMESFNPVFYELMGLSLEEIFISETEVHGYDIKKLIF
ncbi:ABC transporter ATP-binding protein [Lachnoanaerobaculum umeaense]|jgi:ABC-type multidrug transport system, ATPase component|uniref:ABC transporter ATP-binding protein n=1 Tax=Lachnoanaerobaculum umeaense TaxID=617123 RepID=A0A385PXP1_9FIRM|nr:ABC transporter ATP-binding protein [Lachnoanaerobaculum umeaense]AYA98918.1 ABC transporter ATP-binding protein [Lachnoanaerobaculum umeaense]PZW92742.1 ABC-2 type transport system ATP-binding protein [Lachnoanaerobaculum umeaense]